MKKFAGDLAGNIQVQRLTGPVQTNGTLLNIPNTNIAVNKPQAEIKFTIPGNAEPGTYNLVFKGQGQFKYKPDPKVNKTQNLQVTAISPPARVTIYNTVAELAVAKPDITVKAGQQADVVVGVKRLHGYKGELKVQIVLPNGFNGVAAPTSPFRRTPTSEAGAEGQQGRQAESRGYRAAGHWQSRQCQTDAGDEVQADGDGGECVLEERRIPEGAQAMGIFSLGTRPVVMGQQTP